MKKLNQALKIVLQISKGKTDKKKKKKKNPHKEDKLAELFQDDNLVPLIFCIRFNFCSRTTADYIYIYMYIFICMYV